MTQQDDITPQKNVAPQPKEEKPTEKSDPDAPRQREVKDQGIPTAQRTDVPRSVGGSSSGASEGGVGYA